MDETRSKGVRKGTGAGDEKGNKNKTAAVLIALAAAIVCAIAVALIASGGGSGGAPGGAGSGGEDLSAATYSLSFDVGGGTPIAPQAVFKGEKAHRPSDPAKAGMDFAGWYRDPALSVPWSFGDNVTSDMTLYAKWASESRETGPTFKVSFDTRGAPALPDATGIAPGSRMVAPPALAMDGYRMTGWYRDEALSERWDFSIDRVTGDSVLYAGWERVYTVRYHFPDPAVDESEWRVVTAQIAMGETHSLPDPGTRDPYAFGGWFKMVGGVNYSTGYGGPSDNETRHPDGEAWNFDGDMDLYAHWEGSPFVNYVGGGINGGSSVIGPSDGAATHVVIPEYYQGLPVTEIIGLAFSNRYCPLLQSVRLPDTVVIINSFAFEDLSHLTDVNLPSSLVIINDNAFKGSAISWKDPVFPPSLKEMSVRAFYGCPGIEGDLTLPSSLRYIGSGAFGDCPGISSVRIQSETVALGYIGQNAFGGTTDAVIYVDAASAGPRWDPSWSGSCRVVYLRSQP